MKMTAAQRVFNFRYRSAHHWLDIFRMYYGPTHRAFAALDSVGQAALKAEILDLLERRNRGGRETLIVPSEYLEVVLTKM